MEQGLHLANHRKMKAYCGQICPCFQKSWNSGFFEVSKILANNSKNLSLMTTLNVKLSLRYACNLHSGSNISNCTTDTIKRRLKDQEPGLVQQSIPPWVLLSSLSQRNLTCIFCILNFYIRCILNGQVPLL